MAKTKTFKKPRGSKRSQLKDYDPYNQPELQDVQLTIEVLHDCIEEGDVDLFRETLYAHLRSVNKLQFAERAKIGRRTLYDLLDPKKEFNPGFHTLSALFQALKAA